MALEKSESALRDFVCEFLKVFEDIASFVEANLCRIRGAGLNCNQRGHAFLLEKTLRMGAFTSRYASSFDNSVIAVTSSMEFSPLFA